LLTLSMMPLLSFSAEAQTERWVPYVPSPDHVELVSWMKDEVAYVNVTITFYSGGFEVKEWGVVNRKGGGLWADSEIYRWTGPAIQVVWKTPHTYSLGHLKAGRYTFMFKVWGREVQSIDFIIAGRLKYGKLVPLPY